MVRVAAAALILAATVARAADPARDARWRQDLRYLSTELPRLHPNLFFNSPRAEFDKAVAELDGRIPDIPDSGIIVAFSRLVAMAGDGHTAMRRLPFQALPLTLEWFEDGLIVRVAPAEFQRAIGGRVVAIGGVPIEEVHRRVAPVISHETETGLLADSPRYMTMPEVLHAVGVTADPTRATYAVADAGGERIEFELVRGPFPELVEAPVYRGYSPRTLRNREKYYWVESLPNSSTVYFAYNNCQEEPGRPFFLTVRETMALLDGNPGSKFVIDLRNNGGGNAAVITPLVREIEARRAALSEKLFVIVGRQTFSAGVSAAVDLADRAGAKVVGETAGGLVNGTGNVAQMVLPVSRLGISYATAFFRKRPEEGPLAPHVRVARWWSDFFVAYDAELGAVLNDPVDSQPAAGGSDSVAVVNAASGRGAVAAGVIARASGNFGEPEGLVFAVDGEPVETVAVSSSRIEFVVPARFGIGVFPVQVKRQGEVLAEGTMRVAASSPGIFAAKLDGGRLDISTNGTEGKPVRVWIGEDEAVVARRETSRWFYGETLVVEAAPGSRTGPYPVTVVVGGAVSNAVTAAF